MLGAVESDKVHLVATISKDLTPRLKAGDVIKPIAELVGGFETCSDYCCDSIIQELPARRS